MDSPTAQFPYPLQRCKILHLVRHGQAMHNVEGDKNRDALLSPHLFDAQLSPLGCHQVEKLRNYVRSTGLSTRIELVITSPLLRTMQTAVGVFGSELEIPYFPSTMANKGIKDVYLNSPTIKAVELARDRLGVRPCDMRRTISECQSLFPSIDFAMMDGEEDKLWTPDVREPDEEVQARGRKLMKWLWTRPEKEIAVVSHGVVLQHTLNVLGNDSDPSVRTALCKRFDNCEIRSVVIVDKSCGADHQPQKLANNQP